MSNEATQPALLYFMHFDSTRYRETRLHRQNAASRVVAKK